MISRTGLLTFVFLVVPATVAAVLALRLLRGFAVLYIGRYMDDIVMVAGCLGILLAFALVWRSAYATTVYRTLRELGHDVCPHCGYWLQGLGEEILRCPECGGDRPGPQANGQALPEPEAASHGMRTE
jgi:hypothetical protein